MKKVLFLVLLSVFVLTGCSTSQKNDSQSSTATNNNFDNSVKCSQLGSTYFNTMKSEADNEDNQFGNRLRDWEQPQYHYNNKLNSCLILIKYTTSLDSSPIHVLIVEDVLSNKVLITSSFSDDGTFNVNLTYDDFQKQSSDLMNN